MKTSEIWANHDLLKKQIYTRHLNHIDNHFRKYYNEVILPQSFPDDVHFHGFHF